MAARLELSEDISVRHVVLKPPPTIAPTVTLTATLLATATPTLTPTPAIQTPAPTIHTHTPTVHTPAPPVHNEGPDAPPRQRKHSHDGAAQIVRLSAEAQRRLWGECPCFIGRVPVFDRDSARV